MKTLLLVEDDESSLFIYKDLFSKQFNLVIATTFDQFIEKMDCKPDIVLTDFNFPGGNGNDVAKKAKEAGVEMIVLQSNDITSRPLHELYHAVFSKLDVMEVAQFIRSKLV